jgi:hypothetical protein
LRNPASTYKYDMPRHPIVGSIIFSAFMPLLVGRSIVRNGHPS